MVHVFKLINDSVPKGFGHSHFWNIRSETDFKMLWKSKILFMLKRAFLFEEESLKVLTQEVGNVFPASEPEENTIPASVSAIPPTQA